MQDKLKRGRCLQITSKNLFALLEFKPGPSCIVLNNSTSLSLTPIPKITNKLQLKMHTDMVYRISSDIMFAAINVFANLGSALIFVPSR